ncbi:YcnI family copper-binding membrane protein [Paenibacillus silvisoli]|uniref:YcnI family copper-binding membrane protein n=1 Tax=Paenibacillus silvisoli TaxID=3110539 RepID=UPI0028054B68|nr:YcnI family protein [Paenibacillus silvisoli]
MKQRKKWSVLSMAMASLFLFAGIASAHVTVQPKEAAQNSYEVFSVRVPSEKENVTTKVIKVKIPDGVKVSRVEPKAGWKYELETNAETKAIASVTWTAEGDGLAQTEFTDFRISGKVAADAKELVWKAYQTYSDNSLVEWVGGDGADYPASVTTVTAGTGESDGHGGGTSGSAGTAPDASVSSDESSTDAGTAIATDDSAAAQESASAEDSGSKSDTMNRTLSIAALALAASAFVISVSRKKQR